MNFEKNIKNVKTPKKVIKSPNIIEETTKSAPDDDIFDYVEENSRSADVFKKMKELLETGIPFFDRRK